MSRFKSLRFWVLFAFIVLLLAAFVAMVVVGAMAWSSGKWTTDQRIALEGVVVGASSVAVAIIAAVLALAAFALASERPSLRLWTRIVDDYRAGGGVSKRELKIEHGKGAQVKKAEMHWDDLGPVLWIRVYNNAGFSARSPAVRVEVTGYDLNTGTLQVNQGEWTQAEPIGGEAVFAWIWSGSGESIHGPRWFRALPALKITGLKPGAAKASIRIQAVAEGASTVQTISFA